ncbi:SLH domain protein [Peptoanaerobacter stomatis]|uniref:SLH domain protein n=1 Tax=Peptoanaerobacter stomatis TaxID=796937 RepID=J4WH38_9FIRM|nr:S-layer homology domain-containing protein [Peptoanaerobacter stomatis]EJU24481.1 SLH domain protein [Peptoanaerobacter stomatis]NWO25928.1 S-layer homology domain-containing protein [Peptostreptococcaceae bacterium oral taxon 081]
MKRIQAKKMLSIALAMSLTIPAIPSYAISTDTKGHWAEKTITAWQEKGLISGYQDGTFKPNKQVTRAEFIHILNSSLKLTKQGEVKFGDVKETDWFYKDVQIAVGNGYANGTSDNMFMPNATLTRAEAAVFIANILNEKSDKNLIFSDVNTIPAWAKSSVSLMIEKGYMSGYPDNTFAANNKLTRAEAVTILDKVLAQKESDEIQQNTKKEDEKKEEVKKTEQKKTTPSSGGGGGGGSSSSSSSSSQIQKARGAKTVKNAQELVQALKDGYNDITVDGKIEKDVVLNYAPKEELKITINKAQDGLDNINLTAPNTTSIKLNDDGDGVNGTVLNTLTIDAPNAHVESQFQAENVNILRVASSTFKALDSVGHINVQSSAKIEVPTNSQNELPTVTIATDKEVKLKGEYKTVKTTKQTSNIKLEDSQTTIGEFTPDINSTSNTISGQGTIKTIETQSALNIKDIKVENIEVPSQTNKKVSINVQGTAVVDKIENKSDTPIGLNVNSTAQVKKTVGKIEKMKIDINSVSITGNTKVDEILTAEVAPAGADVEYKWQVSDNQNTGYQDIAGQTDKTYKVTADKQEKYIRVVVKGINNYTGEKESQGYKIEKMTQPPSQQKNIDSVTISGVAKVNSELTADISPYDARADYKWQIADKQNANDSEYTDIANATGYSYTVKKDQAGKFIRVVATGKDGYTGSAKSTPIEIEKITVTEVEIDGNEKVGEALKANVKPQSATVTYQWQTATERNGNYTDIPNATQSVYTLTDSDADKYIRVVVNGTGNYQGQKESTPTQKINKLDMYLKTTLKPATQIFHTNISVTTSNTLETQVNFKYSITNNMEIIPEGGSVSPTVHLIDLTTADMLKPAGQDIDITEERCKDIVDKFEQKPYYLTVYEFDNSTGKLAAYSSTRLTNVNVNIPKRKEWTLTAGSYSIDKFTITADRVITVGAFENKIKIMSENQDVTNSFNISVKESGQDVDKNSHLNDGFYISVEPKAAFSHIYKKSVEYHITIKENIDSVSFSKTGVAPQVGDKLTAKILVEFLPDGKKSLEDISADYKYDNVTYRWYRVDNDGNEQEIAGENQRTYIVKEEDKGKSLSVKVKGDGKYVATREVKSGGTLKVIDKKFDISQDGEAYKKDTTKLKIKVLDNTSLTDSDIKIEGWFGNHPWKDIKKEFKIISAPNKEYEVELKDIDKLDGNQIKLTIKNSNYQEEVMPVHRKLNIGEIKNGGIFGKMVGNEIQDVPQGAVLKDFSAALTIHSPLRKMLTTPYVTVYGKDGRLIENPHKRLENGMKIRIRGNLYEQNTYSEYTIKLKN